LKKKEEVREKRGSQKKVPWSMLQKNSAEFAEGARAARDKRRFAGKRGSESMYPKKKILKRIRRQAPQKGCEGQLTLPALKSPLPEK